MDKQRHTSKGLSTLTPSNGEGDIPKNLDSTPFPQNMKGRELEYDNHPGDVYDTYTHPNTSFGSRED